MDALETIRREIDETDKELLRLFEKRMHLVQRVAAYKIEHQLPVLNTRREEEVLKKAEDNLSDPLLLPYGREFLSGLMALSRKEQERLLEKGGDLL